MGTARSREVYDGMKTADGRAVKLVPVRVWDEPAVIEDGAKDPADGRVRIFQPRRRPPRQAHAMSGAPGKWELAEVKVMPAKDGAARGK